MIHVEFRDFQDMLSFARQLLGQVEGEKVEKPVQSAVVAPAAAPVAPAVPIQSLPVTPVVPVPTQTPVVQSVPTAPVQTPVPTTSVTYTPDDLARAAFALMDSGRQQELIGLLQQFGVNAIPELKPEQYGAFATALRGMGAQI